MATFYANPNIESEPWIENPALDDYGFRVWHFMFFCFASFLTILILICCCVKIRVPRTKQQIEADYSRKKLAKKFRERLRLIQNQEMDAMDLQRALEIIQADYKLDNKTINDQIVLEIQTENKQNQTNFAKKITNIMKATSKAHSQSSTVE